MNTDSIAYQYAEALAEISETELLKMEADLNSVRTVISGDADLMIYFSSPRIQPNRKKDQLKKAFGGKVNDAVLSFLNVLVDKRREAHLLDICDAFVEIVDIKYNRIRPTVYVSREFESADLGKINELVEDVILGNKAKFGLNEKAERFEFIVSNEVNPELLGGIALRVGDSYWDASVRRYLKDWRIEIASRQIDERALIVE